MNKILKGIAITIIFLINTSIFSAEQGSLVYGDKSISSSGNLDITLEIAHAIQINKLNDINLGTFKSAIDQDKIGKDKFCVFSNTDSFSLKFSGANGNNFKLRERENSNLNIDYNVELAIVSKNGVISGYSEVENNTLVTNIVETRNELNCVSETTGEFQPNLELKVTVSEKNMLDSLPGNYKDTITIIASPE